MGLEVLETPRALIALEALRAGKIDQSKYEYMFIFRSYIIC